jgi:alkylhydroperoxidase family enzyme
MRLSKPRVEPREKADLSADELEFMGRFEEPWFNIYRTLIHHPDLMRRWLVFANHVLGKSTLPAREREIVILRIGYLCRAGYEWGARADRAAAPVSPTRRSAASRKDRRRADGASSIGCCWQRPTSCAPTPTSPMRPGRAHAAPVPQAADGSGVHGRAVQPRLDGAQYVRRATDPGCRASTSDMRGRLAEKVAIVVGAGQTPRCHDRQWPGDGAAICAGGGTCPARRPAPRFGRGNARADRSGGRHRRRVCGRRDARIRMPGTDRCVRRSLGTDRRAAQQCRHRARRRRSDPDHRGRVGSDSHHQCEERDAHLQACAAGDAPPAERLIINISRSPPCAPWESSPTRLRRQP